MCCKQTCCDWRAILLQVHCLQITQFSEKDTRIRYVLRHIALEGMEQFPRQYWGFDTVLLTVEGNYVCRLRGQVPVKFCIPFWLTSSWFFSLASGMSSHSPTITAGDSSSLNPSLPCPHSSPVIFSLLKTRFMDKAWSWLKKHSSLAAHWLINWLDLSWFRYLSGF